MLQVEKRDKVGGSVDLAGKYRLIAELGQGGMATVYLAVSLGTSGFRKLAVVKLIRPQYASDPDLIQMFLDEARLCARLNHPNIVQTYDVGVDDGQYLMAMEYLDGVSLHTAIARLTKMNTPFPFALRAKVLMEVLEGLRYAHELTDYDGKGLEIVHRDVTPHNIFVTYDGQVKLLDFGIAKAATSSVQTATGVIKGKLTYMAPEQALCDTIDARADLYAIGVMLWESVTGRRRWAAGLSDAAVFTRVASGEMPETPNAASQGLPPEVDEIVLKALAPKREDRYQSAADMRAALDPVLRKIDMSSLRDLGKLLQNAFAEDRKRIRVVIENQFKAMDSGRPTMSTTALPTVHPPRGTDSALHDALSDSMVDAIPKTDDVMAFSEGTPKSSTGTGITGMVTKTSERTKAASMRSRILVGTLGATIVAIAATVGTRALSHHATGANDSATATGAAAHPPVATALPPPVATATVAPPVVAPPPVPVAVPAASNESDRHFEGLGHPGHHGIHAASSAEPAAPEPSAHPEAPAPAPSPDLPNVYHPPTKPKVNLERDNPWP